MSRSMNANKLARLINFVLAENHATIIFDPDGDLSVEDEDGSFASLDPSVVDHTVRGESS